MAVEFNLVCLSFMLLLVSVCRAQSINGIFDVTKYGAKPNADIFQALTNAWKDACATSTNQSKVVIPLGRYMLNQQIELVGPCKSPIELQLQGILQAPTTLPGEVWVHFKYINRLTVAGGGVFDGQGQEAWKRNDCDKNTNCENLPISLKFSSITNSIVRDITSKNSKSFHISVSGCNNLTFHNVNISAPENSVNTDGIHVGLSNAINITNTQISTGDDCVSLGHGSKQVTITNVTCGPGHGFSVGSLGQYSTEEPVEGVRVRNCTLMNTSNGVRIKTWPASPSTNTASDIHYEDIIMVNVSNPILIDQEYCPYNLCKDKTPSKVKISKVRFKNITGSSASALAIKLDCTAAFPCEDVEVVDIDLTYNGSDDPISSQCENVKPIISGKQNPRACSSLPMEAISPFGNPT